MILQVNLTNTKKKNWVPLGTTCTCSYGGNYPWIPAQLHVHYGLCQCDHVFSICYSLYQQEQVIHRLELDIYEVSEDEVGEQEKNAKELSWNLDCNGTSYFVAIGLREQVYYKK